MTVFYGTNAGKVINQVGGTPQQALVAGNVHSFTEIVTFASQVFGTDTIFVARIPKGGIFLRGFITVSATTATATLAIGVVGTPAKYAAAAAYTTVDTPVAFGKAAATGVTLAANDDILLTIGTANLPAAGTATIVIEYAFD